MVGHVNDKGITEMGVGLISVGWMGKLHSRAYQAIPLRVPGLEDPSATGARSGHRPGPGRVRPGCAGLRHGQRRLPGCAGRPRGGRRLDLRSEPPAPGDRIAAAKAGQAVLDREAGRPRRRGYGGDRRRRPCRGRRHRRRLQLPARARGRPDPHARRRRLARPRHQRPLRVPQRPGRRPAGGAVVAVRRELAGSGVLGDLLSHVADLVQYVAGPIAAVTAQSGIVHARRPIQAMGTGTHFDLVEGGELGAVENEDHAAALVRFTSGAIGTLEVSRVAVGPQCGLLLEVYGTNGSATWDFERMNELRVASGTAARTPATPPSWATRTSATTPGSSPDRASRWATTTSRSSRPGASSAR